MENDQTLEFVAAYDPRCSVELERTSTGKYRYQIKIYGEAREMAEMIISVEAAEEVLFERYVIHGAEHVADYDTPPADRAYNIYDALKESIAKLGGKTDGD